MKHLFTECCPPRLLFTLSLLLLSTSCAVNYQTDAQLMQSQKAQRSPPPDQVSFWKGDSLTGNPSVQIKLSEQRAYFYKGDQLVGVSLISTGREGKDTVTGNFRILEKDKNHRSSLFGDYVDANGTVIQKDVDTRKDKKPQGATYVGANMPNFMRITGGTGMHEGFLPGYADSHGCIRMPAFMADAFFRSVSVGTPVKIMP